MVSGNGRIAFAHIEEVIDFDDIDGVKRYVEAQDKKRRRIYYVDSNGYPSQYFSIEKHVRCTGYNKFSIEVFLPYNNCKMGF